MGRDWFINGPTLVLVKGNSGSAFPSVTELGLSDSPIRIRESMEHRPMLPDATGVSQPETQMMGGWADISITFIHFDRAVLAAALIESKGLNSGAAGGAPPGTPQIAVEGVFGGAGFKLGNNLGRFVSQGSGPTQSNHYMGLNFSSPIGGIPYRFLYAYLTGTPQEFPLGTEKSIVVTNWRAVCFQIDPYAGGLGLQGQVLYDHTPDN